MPFPDFTAGKRTLVASVAVLISLARPASVLSDEWPGSRLSIQRAKAEASFIVVAEVGKTADVLRVEATSILFWTELKPSASIKGKVTGEELNTHPLTLTALGSERLPRSGEEYIVFIRDDLVRFPIIKLLPKTEENLAAIAAAPPNPGATAVIENRDFVAHPGGGLGSIGGGGLGGGLGGGGNLGGGSRPIHPTVSPPPDRGTTIVPDPGATGERLKIENEFAAVMSRDDPKPEGRKAHFAWLNKNEYVRRFGVRQIGWYGAVTGCEPRPDGVWLVKVTIRPWLVGGLRFTGVNDTVEETYEFVAGRARLIDTNAATEKPDQHVFPVAI